MPMYFHQNATHVIYMEESSFNKEKDCNSQEISLGQKLRERSFQSYSLEINGKFEAQIGVTS